MTKERDLEALSAWLDGETAEPPAAPQAGRMADYAAIDAALRREAAGAEPVPLALAAAVRAGFAARRRAARRAALARWAAPLAASVAVVALGLGWAEHRAEGELLARREAVAALVEEAVQAALETAESGAALTRGDPASVGVTVTPTRTYRSVSQHWCREFEERIVIDGETVVRFGLACREPDRGWTRVETRDPGAALPPI